MQIRDRGKSIKLIRTTYDPEEKKPTRMELAKVVRPDLMLSDADREKLTPDELEEFEAFRSKALRAVSVEHDYAAHRFPETLELVGKWLSAAPREQALAFIESVQKPLKQIRRQINSLTNTGNASKKKRDRRQRSDSDGPPETMREDE